MERTPPSAGLPTGGDGSEHPFAAAVGASSMPMTVIDPARPGMPVTFCNEAFLLLTGYERDEVVGRPWNLLNGMLTEGELANGIERAMVAGEPVRADIVNYRKDGRAFWNGLHISPVRDRFGALRCLFATHFDLTVMKHREGELARARAASEWEVRQRTAELEAALEARTMLLHEVDHRVKNNLLTIASIVKLQARRADDQVSRDALTALLRRVEAIGAAQRRLLGHADASRFDVAAFTRELAEDLVNGTSDAHLEIDSALDPVLVTSDKASPLALIVNEIMSDAIARTEGTVGARIDLSVGNDDRGFLLRVAATDSPRVVDESFRHTLIEACARQAGASVAWCREEGRRVVEVRLPEGTIAGAAR